MTVEHVPVPPGTPTEPCPRCGAKFLDRAVFCQYCGATRPSMVGQHPMRPYPQRIGQGQYQQRPPGMARTPWRVIAKAIVAIGAFSLVGFIVIDTITLIYGTTLVLPEVGSRSFPLYVVAPTLITIYDIWGTALETYYVLLVAAITVSVGWVLWRSAPGFIQEISMKGESRKHSAIFDLCTLMFAVTFMNFAIVFLMLLAGYNPTDAIGDADLWELLFLLANASVWEEIVSRVLLIGVPLLLIDFARRKLRPKPYSYFLGGGFELGIPEVGLLMASSVFFGFAHYEGWGSWKVFPAAVAGVAFGYLFLRHGLASAIVLHFAFDYLSIPGEVFGMGIKIVTVVLTVIWVAIGFACFIYFLTRIAEFVTGSRYLEPAISRPEPVWFAQPRPMNGTDYGGQARFDSKTAWGPVRADANVNQPPGYRGISGGYVCPVCGGTEARWTDGRFQCLRCGSLL